MERNRNICRRSFPYRLFYNSSEIVAQPFLFFPSVSLLIRRNATKPSILRTFLCSEKQNPLKADCCTLTPEMPSNIVKEASPRRNCLLVSSHYAQFYICLLFQGPLVAYQHVTLLCLCFWSELFCPSRLDLIRFNVWCLMSSQSPL